MKLRSRLLTLALAAVIPLAGLAAQTAPLKVWVYDQGRVATLTQIGKDFEAKYKIPVEVSMVDLGQIRSQFLLASGGAECADIAIIPHDNLGALVENSAVVDINLAAKKSNYLTPSIDGFMYNGKLYGLPLSVENIAFFRNTDLVPKAPATWDDMIKVGADLMKAGKTTAIMGFPDATYNVFPIFSSFGGGIFDKKADGSLDGNKLLIANAGMVKGLELMTKMVNAKQAPGTIDWDGSHVLFETGKAPFICTGPWALDRFKKAGVKYEISAFPAATKGGKAGQPFLGVQGMIVSSASKQVALAKVFLTEFVATEKNMKAIHDADLRPSAWKTIASATKDKDSLGFAAAGVAAIPMPSIPAMGYVWDAWVNAAALAFAGTKTPADALANAKTQIETQIAAKK